MAKWQTIGARRHHVQIYRRSVTTVGVEAVPKYTAGEFRWASIEPMSVRELLIREDSQVFSECTHKVTMLYTANLSAKDQLRFGTRTFEIVGLINQEEINRQLVAMCVERT